MRRRTTASPLKGNKIEKVNNSSNSSIQKPHLDVRIKKDVVKEIPVEDRIAPLTASIRSNPYDSQLYYQRGILFFNQGKTTEALNDYNRAIKINPQIGKAYYARAELWAALDNKRLALLNLEKAMELEGIMGEVVQNVAVDDQKKALSSD